MNLTTLELLTKAMNTEFVVVTRKVFDKVKGLQEDVSPLEIRDSSGERHYAITYYVVDGNIIGSWENFTGVVMLEKSLVPERAEGWYRVKIDGEYQVAQYDSEWFFMGEGVEESDFEWIDDNPITFPEE